jgi:hypothetical protein
MNRIPEKLQNMGCKVKKKQWFTDYVSYLSTQYFVIFLEYGSCPVKPLLSSNSTVYSSIPKIVREGSRRRNTPSDAKFRVTVRVHI